MRRLFILFLLGAVSLSSSIFAQTTTILESFSQFECHGVNSGTFSKHISLRIDNKRGLSDGNFVCSCSPYRNLKKFAGTIHDANGKVVKKIKRSDLVRTEYSSSLASDDYSLYYEAEVPASYPITVTYDWEVDYSHHLNSYPSFFPIPGYEIAVDTASFTFIQRPENTLTYRILNFSPHIKVSESDGNRRITEFSIGHISHMDKQSWGQSFNDRTPQVIMSPLGFEWNKIHCDMTDWHSFGLWINELNSGRQKLTPEVIARLHQTTDTCTTPRSKVKATRKLLGELTRYVSIQLGIGGYQTATAEDVCKNGIGDCKALSNCFIAMLHEIGLPAVYTLIALNDRHLIHDMPNFSQLDHVIVQVPLPGDTLWVECTNDTYPFDYRHTGMCGHDVVLIHPTGGELQTIPEYADSLNLRQIFADIELSSDGSAHISYRESNFNSQFEALCNLTRIPTKDQQKNLLNRIVCGNPTINDMSIQSEGAHIDYMLDIQSGAFCKWSNNRIFLPITLNPFSPLQNTKEEAHIIDILGEGKLRESTIRYRIPDGYDVDSKLDPLFIDSPFGFFSRHTTIEDGYLVIRDSFLMRNGIYPAEHFPEWIAFRKALADSSKKKIILKAI